MSRPARRARRWALVWLVLAGMLGSGPALRPEQAEARRRHEKKPRAAKRDVAKEVAKAQATEQTATAASALQAKDYATALKLLAEAYAQFPNPETLFQLGALAEAEGRIVEAQDLLRRYLLDPTVQATPEAQAQVQRVLDLPRQPSGEVNVLGERGALVLLDGRPVGVVPLPLPLLVTAGSHTISLEGSERTMKGKLKVPDGRGAEMRFDADSGAVLVTLPPLVVVLAEYPPLPPPPLPPPSLPPGSSPPAPPQASPQAETQKRMGLAVAQAVRRANLALLNTEVARARAPKVAGCLATLPCQIELAQKSEADYVLRIKVERAVAAPAAPPGRSEGAGVAGAAGAAGSPGERADWQLSQSLIDPEVGDIAATVSERCAGCTAEQAIAQLGTAVERTLERGLGRGRGTLKVTSVPPGAEVRLVVGNRLLGETPLERPVWAGAEPVELEVVTSGYQAQRTRVLLREGKSEAVALTLLPEIEPAPAPLRPTQLVWQSAPRPKWRLATGAVALALGLGVGTLGVSALAVDGTCTEDLVMPRLACRQRYDTSVEGLGLTLTGAVLTVGGIVLMSIPGPRRQVEVPTQER